MNAIELVARLGDAEQRARLREEVARGYRFGVWNTQGSDGVTLDVSGERLILGGAKTWASGAPTIERPLITARRADDSLALVQIRRESAALGVDTAGWHPLGMERSQSFRVAFDGIEVERDQLIGPPGAYEAKPWFLGGALRFVAVQSGGIERIVSETARFARVAGRHDEPFVLARLAEMAIALQSCRNWVRAGAAAWDAFDIAPGDDAARNVLETADMARLAVERAAFDVMEHAERTVGAHGLLQPLPFEGLVRDLQMYLRQPAPDAVLLRVGKAAVAKAATTAPATATRTRG